MTHFSQNPHYQSALNLRRTGHSYSEISRQLGLSKGTLSYWFSQDAQSQTVKETLKARWQANSSKKVELMNKKRIELATQRHNNFRLEAQKQYNSLAKNSLFMVGLSLYWGEGSKTTNGRVGVINSDPKMLKIIAAFYRQVLHVPEEKIRAELFIYKDHNPNSTLAFWSNELNIPQNQFIKTQILPSRSQLTQHRTRYGMCNVYFSSTEFSIKIHEWINILSARCENSSVG